jgi:hypothetical protein
MNSAKWILYNAQKNRITDKSYLKLTNVIKRAYLIVEIAVKHYPTLIITYFLIMSRLLMFFVMDYKFDKTSDVCYTMDSCSNLVNFGGVAQCTGIIESFNTRGTHPKLIK